MEVLAPPAKGYASRLYFALERRVLYAFGSRGQMMRSPLARLDVLADLARKGNQEDKGIIGENLGKRFAYRLMGGRLETLELEYVFENFEDDVLGLAFNVAKDVLRRKGLPEIAKLVKQWKDEHSQKIYRYIENGLSEKELKAIAENDPPPAVQKLLIAYLNIRKSLLLRFVAKQVGSTIVDNAASVLAYELLEGDLTRHDIGKILAGRPNLEVLKKIVENPLTTKTHLLGIAKGAKWGSQATLIAVDKFIESKPTEKEEQSLLEIENQRVKERCLKHRGAPATLIAKALAEFASLSFEFYEVENRYFERRGIAYQAKELTDVLNHLGSMPVERQNEVLFALKKVNSELFNQVLAALGV